MADENELKPLDLSKVKASTSRIDLSKATIPASPATSGIRIGTNPKKATSRIDIAAIPGAVKAQTSRVGLGAMPPMDEDVYKRRTTLLDTGKIPLATAPAVQPRTIRIGTRPTVRVSASAPTTFSPGQAAEAEAAPEAAAVSRPTIKLKRPGGGSSITVSSSAGAPSAAMPEPMFTIQGEDTPGAVWAALSIVSLLVLIGLVTVQVLTLQGAAY